MIQFNFLRSARPLFVRRVLEVRLPPEFAAPLFAIAAAALIISGAFAIEYGRLARATAAESAFQLAYMESQQQISRTRVLYAGLERTVALAKEVRAIQASGAAQEVRFAEIGNRLPPHIWLTAIADDDSGMLLSGKATNLTAISHAMSNLARSRHRYAATLVSAGGDDRSLKSSVVQYQLHLQAAVGHPLPWHQ